MSMLLSNISMNIAYGANDLRNDEYNISEDTSGGIGLNIVFYISNNPVLPTVATVKDGLGYATTMEFNTSTKIVEMIGSTFAPIGIEEYAKAVVSDGVANYTIYSNGHIV